MNRSPLLLALLALACGPTIPEGRFACTASSECPSGWSCLNSLCYSTSSLDGSAVDAGTDAGTDAGAEPEAGTDAGFDAGQDAGDVDAGPCGALMECGGSCIDTTMSIDHCGGCSTTCSPVSSCRASVCRPRVEGTIHFGSTGWDSARDVAFDPVGNAYVVGQFAGTVDFGGGTTATSAGGSDGFVASFGPDGVLRWVLPMGGTADDVLRSAAWDPSTESVIVVGTFQRTASFGPTGGTTIASAGDRDVVVAAMSESGRVQWARSIGGAGTDTGKRVATGGGRIYVAMDYTAGFTFAGVAFPASGMADSVVLDMTETSGPTRAMVLAGSGNDVLDGVAADGTFVCAAGFFEGNFMLDDGTMLTSIGGADAIVWCRDFAGGAGWARTFGSDGADQLSAIAIGTEEVYFAGVIGGATSIGSYLVSAPEGVWDVIVGSMRRALGARMGMPSGLTQFISTGDYDYPSDLAIDAHGQVIVTAGMAGTVRSPVTLANAGGSDAFIAALAPDLTTVAWARMYGSSGDDSFPGVGESPAGELWVTGEFHGSVDFGGSAFSAVGDYDAVVLRLSP